MSEASDTPETDKFVSSRVLPREVGDELRQLERERNEASQNPAGSRGIVRNQKSFIAELNEENDKLVAERDELRARVAELEGALPSDKWFDHVPGDAMPCDEDLWVEIEMRCGERETHFARSIQWCTCSQSPDLLMEGEVMKWRPAK